MHDCQLKLIILVILLSVCGVKMEKNEPKVLVFDLDYTLWPFWVDTHVQPPFKKSANGTIQDTTGAKVICYPESEDVLKNLHKRGYVLAVASRTGEIKGANQLIELLGWSNYFSHREIYPGRKDQHLTNIKRKYEVGFNDIIFFDDEGRNIRDVSELGVLSILVKNGITQTVVEDGLQQFYKRSSSSCNI